MKFMLQVFQFIFSLFLFDSNPPSTADLILVNGKVITVDQNFTIAEAVAIKKDKIPNSGASMPRLLCAHEYLCPQIFFATSHKTLRLLIANIV